MYDSGITVADFITEIKGETDISSVISDTKYERWLRAAVKVLYNEVILEQKIADITNGTYGIIDLSEITPGPEEAEVTYDDILRIYADGYELQKSSNIGAYEFQDKNLFYKISEASVGYHTIIGDNPEKVTVIYTVRPSDNCTNVMIPLEWIDMVGCKMRGEAYKLANDDVLSAKWINDYNTRLENFKLWCASRRNGFGA